ncbi:MAG: PilX N-terminal domain-containing pilus assembly protein [Acidobacteriota bacterium]
MRWMKEQRVGFHKRTGERGAALVVALLVMVVLSLLGIAFLSASLTESNIASNEADSAKAFNLAEAGLERAKRTLKMSTFSSLNAFLPAANTDAGEPGPFLFGQANNDDNALGEGNYIVEISDNNDDGNPNNDIDDVVFVTSTGSVGNAQRRVVALVTVPLVPDPEGSVEMIAPAGETELELENSAVIDGNDWDPPADLSACTLIASCGTNLTAIDPTANPAVAGTSVNSLDNEVKVTAPAAIFGNPPTELNGTLSDTPWNNLVDQLIAQADRNLTVPEILIGTFTWGTPSAPEITVISSPEIKIKDPTTSVNGAGILIIDDLGELKLDHGTLNWQGLIIVRGDEGLEIEFEGDTDATARIFGAMIGTVSGIDPEMEMEIENPNSFIKYSSSSINMVRGFLPVTVQSWQEVPM